MTEEVERRQSAEQTMLMDKKISQIDVDLAQTKTALDSFQASVNGQLHELRNDLSEFMRAVRDGAKPNYNTYAAIIGVVFVVIGAFGSGYVNQLSDMSRLIEKLTDSGLKGAERYGAQVEIDRRLDDSDETIKEEIIRIENRLFQLNEKHDRLEVLHAKEGATIAARQIEYQREAVNARAYEQQRLEVEIERNAEIEQRVSRAEALVEELRRDTTRAE